MRELMRLWYLSYRRSAKVQAILRIHSVSPEPSLFAHMRYGSRQRVRLKIRHLAPLDGCACAGSNGTLGTDGLNSTVSGGLISYISVLKDIC